jgi:hypothetical protein
MCSGFSNTSAVINATGFSVSAVVNGHMNIAVPKICIVPNVKCLCRWRHPLCGQTLPILWFSFLLEVTKFTVILMSVSFPLTIYIVFIR